MNTDIEYLRQLDTDLAEAITREQAQPDGAFGGGAGHRKRVGRTWVKMAGAAAAFLVVAGAIGFIFSPTARHTFQEVGDAVSSGGDEGSGGGAAAPSPASPPDATPGDGTRSGEILDEASPGGRADLSKIIRDGRIGVVVPDGSFDDTVGDLTFIAEEEGGFILSSATRNERSGTFVLRIPATRFDRALGAIRELGDVRFQTVSGDDVTAEYIDFQARLRILQARRALLLGLLRDAETTEEILRISGQLDDVQLRVEQIQGQLRFLDDQIAVSTLRVSIQERNAPATAQETEVDNPDLGSAFELAVQGCLRIIGAVIVGLGYLVPLTILGALVWLVVWLARRRRATA